MLTEDKLKLEASIKELRKQELSHHQELETTKNQIQEYKVALTQTTNELKTTQEQLRIVDKQMPSHVSLLMVPTLLIIILCFVGG